MNKSALTGAMCLILGVLLGYVVRGTNKGADSGSRLPRETIAREERAGQTASPPRHHQDDSSKTIEADALVTSMQGQIRRLTQENQSLQARASAVTRPPADETKMLVPKRLVPKLRLESIGDGYNVEQDVVDVLGITDAEKKQLESALIDTRARLDELEIKHSTVLSQTAVAVELSISPFALDGEEIRSKLIGDVRTVLGDERSDFFTEFARQTIDDRFNHFGQASQNVKVTMEDDGRMRVHSQFTIKMPTGGTASGGRSESYEKDRLPDNVRHLFDVK
jgi:prefoldin subunit 5